MTYSLITFEYANHNYSVCVNLPKAVAETIQYFLCDVAYHRMAEDDTELCIKSATEELKSAKESFFDVTITSLEIEVKADVQLRLS